MARVLITGSTDGLGLAAARTLVDEGHTVVVHARNRARASDLPFDLGPIVIGDLSSADETRDLARQVNELGRLDAVIALIIIGREIAISALREWMAQIGKGKSMAVSFLGKLKTVSQMAAIPLLLYHDKIGENFDPQEIGTWLIYLAAILTLWSMAYYLKVAIPQALKHG